MERSQSNMSHPIRSRSAFSMSNSLPRKRPTSSHSKYMLTSHLPLRKMKPEPWQRLFDGEKQQIYHQQGFCMKKSKQNIDAIINDDLFIINDNTISDSDFSHNTLPPVIQGHIDRLSAQIDDLALQLAEERLNHKQTRVQAEENLRDLLENQTKQYQEQLHKQMLAFQQEIEKRDQRHVQILNTEQSDSIRREEALKNQIDLLKASFHTYKSSMEQQNTESIREKVAEARELMKKEMEEKQEDLKSKLNETVLKERRNLAARQKMEIETLKKQHEKEIETIHKNFANTAFDRTRVENLTKELISTKLELDETKERSIQLATKLKDLEIQHATTSRELRDFQMRFEEKQQDVERSYAGKLDRLQLQNADLRIQYLKKCSELVNERSLVTSRIEENANILGKDLRRRLFDVRLTTATPLIIDDEPRRLSICATAYQLNYPTNRSQSTLSNYREESFKMGQESTDFTMHNVRRTNKLHRRASLPTTEKERDVIRYINSIDPCHFEIAPTSKYDFRSEEKMIKNMTLEDLQRHSNQS